MTPLSNCFIESLPDKAKLAMISSQPCLFLSHQQPVFQPSALISASGFATKQLGAQPHRLCLLQAASGSQSQGFKQIATWRTTSYNKSIPADGVHIVDGDTVTIFQTADCMAVVFYHHVSQQFIVVHCGRPAGTPVNGESILTLALRRLCPNNDVENVRVWAIGSISGKNFPNEEGVARGEADQYLKEYGEAVFTNVATRSLDMRLVLRHVCQAAGMTAEQLSFVGPDCTYDAPYCASHREHSNKGWYPRTVANTIMLVT